MNKKCIKIVLLFFLVNAHADIRSHDGDVRIIQPLITRERVIPISQLDDNVLRTGHVQFNSALLSAVKVSDSTSHGTHRQRNDIHSDVLTIQAFDDTSLHIVLQEEQQHAHNRRSYRGRTLDSDLSNVVLVVAGDEFIITVNNPTSTYRMMGKNGSGQVKELKTSAVQCGIDVLKPNFSPSVHDALKQQHIQEKQLPATATMRALAPAAKVTIDVLLVYNTNAQQWLRSEGISVATYSQAIQAHLNNATRNSELNVEFRVLSDMTVSDAAGKFFEKLYEIGGDKVVYTDASKTRYFLETLPESERGLYNAINNERERTGADLVAYLAREKVNGSSTGIANLLTTTSPDARDSNNNVYSVSVVDDTLGTTLIHELGHNFGGGHSTRQNGPNARIGNHAAGTYVLDAHEVREGNLIYSYNGYNTIMAYNFYNEGGRTRYFNGSKLLFSSPSLTINGSPAGNSATADNRRVIATTASGVSNYRTCKVNCGSTSVTTGTIFDDGFE